MRGQLVGIASILLLGGCEPAKHSFMAAQVCLGDKAAFATFKNVLQSIADTERMDYGDSSASTEQGLITVGARDPASQVPTLNATVYRPDDSMAMSAANLGMPDYQIVVNFTEGADALAARAFAERVVKRLQEQWEIEVVPAGEGARGMKRCTSRGLS